MRAGCLRVQAIGRTERSPRWIARVGVVSRTLQRSPLGPPTIALRSLIQISKNSEPMSVLRGLLRRPICPDFTRLSRPQLAFVRTFNQAFPPFNLSGSSVSGLKKTQISLLKVPFAPWSALVCMDFISVASVSVAQTVFARRCALAQF